MFKTVLSGASSLWRTAPCAAQFGNRERSPGYALGVAPATPGFIAFGQTDADAGGL